MLIDINSLHKQYGNKIIYNNFNMHVDYATFTAIVGKSGCGKSTLLNILGLLDDDFSGDYFFQSKNVSSIREKERAKLRNESIGFVFQNYNLIEELNVLDNIYLPYCYSAKKLTADKKAFISDMLIKLKIDNLCQQKVQYLSGGEKQRVAVARALALDPVLILADEPTGNLDSENTKVIIDYFATLRGARKSIVMVTHNLSILGECDQVIELK